MGVYAATSADTSDRERDSHQLIEERVEQPDEFVFGHAVREVGVPSKCSVHLISNDIFTSSTGSTHRNVSLRMSAS
jgi:hypothetical protein